MKTRTTLAALGALLALAGVASANTIDVRYLGKQRGRDVKTTLNGSSQNVFAGQLLHRFSNGKGLGKGIAGDIATYCTDLLEFVTTSTRTFNIARLEDAPAPAMGVSRAAAITGIYSRAAGAQNAFAVSDDYAAAFQIAVWEIVYDYDPAVGMASLDITKGNLRVTRTNGQALSSAIASLLPGIFSGIGSAPGGFSMMAVTRSGAQDQILPFVMVPTPVAGAMGLAGLGFVAARRRR